MRLSLKIVDGERRELGSWQNMALPVDGADNGGQEVSFTGPDGAPWYLEIAWADATSGISMEGAMQHIESYSDYELTSEVYRRITAGQTLEEHEPYMETEG